MSTFGQLRLRLTKAAPGLDPDLLDGFLNDRYQEVLQHLPWSGLVASGVLATVAAYDTGTVTVYQGSASVAGTGTSWSADHTGRRIRIGTDAEFYTFTYTSGTSGSLDRPYEGDSDAVDSSYRIFQNVYPLPADLDILTSVRRLDGVYMERISSEALEIVAPGRQSYGEPTMFAPAAPDPNAPNVPRVELYPIPIAGHAYQINYGRSVATISSQDTSAELLMVVRDNTIYAGVRADIQAHLKDYAGSQVYEARFNKLLADARSSESARRPASRMKIADRYTRHQNWRWQR
jgi:hypothetical protein